MVGISQSQHEKTAEKTSSQPQSKPLPQLATDFLLLLFAFLSHISHPQGARCFLLRPVEGTVQCSKTVQNGVCGVALSRKRCSSPIPSILKQTSHFPLTSFDLRWAGTGLGFPGKARCPHSSCGQQPEDAKHPPILLYFSFLFFKLETAS